MVTETLVSFDIENGQQIIDALDRDGKTPNVAMWLKIPDYETWRLLIASECLGKDPERTGYSEIVEALNKANIPIHRQPTIMLRPMDDPMVMALRENYADREDTYGMRVGSRRFGNKLIEESFVYRIS